MNGHHLRKAQLLAMVSSARAMWDSLIAEAPETWMSESGADGEWAVKDTIAHIAWGERESCGVVEAHALVGSELWRLSEEERNAAVFESNRHRTVPDVLAESRQVFQRYLAAIDTLSDEDLNDPSRFPGMPDGWLPWRIMYDPAHYDGHARSIRAWLERRQQEEP